MKTARIVGVVALGVLAAVYGVALPRTRLRAEGPKVEERPVSLPRASLRSGIRLELPATGPSNASNPFSGVTPRGAYAPLQQRFVELMKIKAERMSEDELKAAMSELQVSLDTQDREAEAALQEAVAKLREVVNNHQGTRSADKARKAIVMMGFKPDEVVIPAKPADPTLLPDDGDAIPKSRIKLDES